MGAQPATGSRYQDFAFRHRHYHALTEAKDLHIVNCMDSPLNSICVRLRRLCAAGLFLVGLVPAVAESAASYLAPVNPTSPEAGWKSAGRASGGSPIDKPEPAWRIAPAPDTALSYSYPEPEDLLRKAFSEGWKFSARLRLDLSSAPEIGRHVASLAVENPEKKEAFVLWIRSTDGNTALVAELNGKLYPLPGLAPDAFHTYAMAYDPVTSTVNLTADGQAVSDGIRPAETERWFLRWGHSSISAHGAAEWVSVDFATPPPKS